MILAMTLIFVLSVDLLIHGVFLRLRVVIKIWHLVNHILTQWFPRPYEVLVEDLGLFFKVSFINLSLGF